MVAILGPRQVGKTTLAQQIGHTAGVPVSWLDLERPADLNRLADDPELVLGELQGLVVIDEVQRLPDLFPVLRVLSDRHQGKTRFLLLGIASPDLLQQSSETLAGRINYYRLGGLSLHEVGYDNLSRSWLRGGFPRAWLAPTDSDAFLWLESFAQTFLERDLPGLGIRVPGPTLRRFWTMLAHRHGQVLNSSEFARSFGVSDTTIRRYLDILTGALVIRQIQPWHANIAKRQIKSFKVYIRDMGIFHALLGIESIDGLQSHPKSGASWEGYMLEAIINRLRLEDHQVQFWVTHTGAEIDLIIARGQRLIGIEVKRTTAPKVTPSMRSAIRDLQLSEVVVVHAGQESCLLGNKVRGVASNRLFLDLNL